MFWSLKKNPLLPLAGFSFKFLCVVPGGGCPGAPSTTSPGWGRARDLPAQAPPPRQEAGVQGRLPHMLGSAAASQPSLRLSAPNKMAAAVIRLPRTLSSPPHSSERIQRPEKVARRHQSVWMGNRDLQYLQS